MKSIKKDKQPLFLCADFQGDGLSIRDTSIHGLRLLRLENEWLSASILPGFGAKILAVLDKTCDRQILWENPRIRPQSYPFDANFDN
jgi:hypothetical protein